MQKAFGWTPEVHTDPMKKAVFAQLEKDKVHITGPSRTQSPHIQLPVDAFMELRNLYGNMKVGGKTLFESIQEVQRAAFYTKGTDGPQGSKQALISSVTSAYKDAAWASLLAQKENDRFKWQALREEWERAQMFKAGRIQ